MELVGAPFRWGSAIRHRRVFHPDGVFAEGLIERVAPADTGLPLSSAAIVARLSKALGTPGALPDIEGLAVRVLAQGDSPTDWDILLASAGSGVVGRSLGLRPVTTWAGQSLTSLAPLHYRDRNWWLRARILTGIADFGLSLDAVRRHLEHSEITIELDQARAMSAFQPLARVVLTNPVPDRHVSFDPVLHTAPGVEMYPRWLADLRAYAYAQSREGRGEGHDSTARSR